MEKLTRRSFFKRAVISAAGLALAGRFNSLWAGKGEHAKRSFWKGKLFRQTNVSMKEYSNGFIQAHYDGCWHRLPIRTLSPEFMKWNTEARLETLDNIATGKMPQLAGPHSGAVASYGTTRIDSLFKLNNAIKGIGFAPRPEKLPGAIQKLKDTVNDSMEKKLETLKSFYKEEGFLDPTKQTSLELYTTPDFETHTFLNIMANPVVSIVFLDMPSYEVRAVARIIHPDDDRALEEEKLILDYTNRIHSYFHGEFPRLFPVLIFHVVELFDNSPGKMRGIRVVPPRPT